MKMNKINQLKTKEEIVDYFEYHKDNIIKKYHKLSQGLILEEGNEINKLYSKCGEQLKKITQSKGKKVKNEEI